MCCTRHDTQVPTWTIVQTVLVALVASLLMLLHIAINSGSLVLILNVLMVIALAAGLILLLRWYVFSPKTRNTLQVFALKSTKLARLVLVQAGYLCPPYSILIK
jgi:hypothetical protein